MLLIDDGTGGFSVVDARLRDRVIARLRADHLDQALADGASPDASLAIALRAQALTTTQARHELADGLQRVVSHAQKPLATAGRMPLNRGQILAAVADIEELRWRLQAHGPVSVRGVAQTKALLTSGTGPMYRRTHPQPLIRLVRQAIDALNILTEASSRSDW